MLEKKKIMFKEMVLYPLRNTRMLIYFTLLFTAFDIAFLIVSRTRESLFGDVVSFFLSVLYLISTLVLIGIVSSVIHNSIRRKKYTSLDDEISFLESLRRGSVLFLILLLTFILVGGSLILGTFILVGLAWILGMFVHSPSIAGIVNTSIFFLIVLFALVVLGLYFYVMPLIFAGYSYKFRPSDGLRGGLFLKQSLSLSYFSNFLKLALYYLLLSLISLLPFIVYLMYFYFIKGMDIEFLISVISDFERGYLMGLDNILNIFVFILYLMYKNIISIYQWFVFSYGSYKLYILAKKK